MNNLKIGTRLTLMLSGFLFVTLAIGFLGLRALQSTNADFGSVYNDRVVPLQQMKAISDAYGFGVVEVAQKARLGALTTDEALAQIDRSEQIVTDEWGEFIVTVLTPKERELIAQATPQLATAGAAIAELRAILQEGDVAAIDGWLSATAFPALDPIVDTTRELALEQTTAAKAEYDEATVRYSGTRNLILALTLLGTLLGALIGWWIIRDITSALRDVTTSADRIAGGDLTATARLSFRGDELGAVQKAFGRMVENLSGLISNVQRSGIQVNTSATEIAATARQQQATGTEIASTVLEVGTTAREISATSRELVRTMENVMQSAEQMAGLAGSGQGGLGQMQATMDQIREGTRVINTRFELLNDRAANITTMVTTISKVADQTNLLSLNAAIEAEKAGEYGRGFSVVAAEIRRLADQTGVATTDIEHMVREIQAAISTGVMGMDKFSEEVRRGLEAVSGVSGQLAEILHQVQDVTPRFETVVEGMQAQAQGAEQISEALAQLGEASQQTAESLANSASAIEQLNEAAVGLQSGVARFRLTS